MKMKLSIIFSLILLSIILAGCEEDSTSPNGTPGTNEVIMSGNSFSPASITVAEGTTVTWTNRDAVQHTVTSSTTGFPFDSGNLNRDQSFSFTFDSTGTYSYYCKLHAGMTGTVIVQ
jgi:plastocyanin